MRKCPECGARILADSRYCFPGFFLNWLEFKNLRAFDPEAFYFILKHNFISAGFRQAFPLSSLKKPRKRFPLHTLKPGPLFSLHVFSVIVVHFKVHHIVDHPVIIFISAHPVGKPAG